MSSPSREVPARELAVAGRPREHACCRFAAAEDRRRIAVDVIRAGLRHGHRVLYVCDREDVQDFVSELAELDDDVGPALERDRLEVRSSAETYAPEGRSDQERVLATWCEARVGTASALACSHAVDPAPEPAAIGRERVLAAARLAWDADPAVDVLEPE